ncbi:MAG: diaminopimelate decarboxylase [Clostridia bacterium]|nr:diaminopimelate decarboxylase [Clostridia bacterium]MDD4387271.1 diaminopimelate decarboxylase [Clostridia bacterium]
MININNPEINEIGHLVIGGMDVVDLVKKYGTPLYVIDEETFVENMRKFKNSIDKFYNRNGRVLYASKTFCCIEAIKIAAAEGLGIDVVSGGELYTAIKAGINPLKIVFHGNNKSIQELEMAIESKVGRIIVDSIYELNVLNQIAKEKSVIVDIMLRIKPGIDVHTHDYIKTGQIDSKFGIALENKEAEEAVKEAIGKQNINLMGLHCHIGSQIFDVEPFEDTAEIMLEFIADIKNKYNYEILELNLGGGFGIMYTNEDNPVAYEKYMELISKVVIESCSKFNIKVPFIYIEPGRSISGPAGITLYTVGTIKEIEGIRKYVSIDGGMTDNPRYALYQAKYTVRVANKMNETIDDVITLAGKCCESGDLLGENMKIQKPEPLDIIVVYSTGAYNYSMSSNYNRILKPPVIMINDRKSRVIVKGETFEDLIRNDI